MAKPFLIIQLRPEDVTADDELAAIKRYGGLRDSQVVRIRAEQSGLPALSLDDYSGIIVGGSPFDISATEKSAIQLRIENDFRVLFDDVTARDFPFLGCCSGNGLLGRYCGAVISEKFAEPVGGVEVEVTSAGRQDPLLVGLPNRFRVLLGHKEACDGLPPGTVLLVQGERCPVQMFRLKHNIYATQFHPEADVDGFTVRIHAYRDHGYFAPEAADEIVDALQSEQTHYANTILKRFVDRYRS